MIRPAKHIIPDFHHYPSVGDEDWQYAFAAANVKSLVAKMLTKATFIDMATAKSFEAAVDMLGNSEYALPQGNKTFDELEKILKQRRTEARKLFKKLIIDEQLVELILEREDSANLRLALRRKLTEKPLGADYSNDGSVPAEKFEGIFEEENYSPLPLHMREAIEKAVLAYYQNKDIRQIDYAIDSAQAAYRLGKAMELENVFLTELFRMQVDLTNIRTMLRLKFSESEQQNVFLEGGYIGFERLKHGIDVGYEAMGPLFASTPYYNIVESGASYLALNKSFLKLEHNCEMHLNGYLKSTSTITAGAQPIVAYLLMKEHEIRMVRLVLTAKKNALDTRLILDRLGE